METLTEKTRKLLQEARDARDPKIILEKVKELHRFLSEVNGFRRVGEDWHEAERLYNETVRFDLIVRVEDAGLIRLNEMCRYDHILCSPEQRGPELSYDRTMAGG